MAGLLVFRHLHDAIKAGFQIYDRFADGYIVRQMTASGWQMAIVSFRDRPELPEHPDSSHLDQGRQRPLA